MIAFFFPIILGALIGFTFDDGNINKSDFNHINKELVDPMLKPLVSAKDSVVKAYKEADFSGVDNVVVQRNPSSLSSGSNLDKFTNRTTVCYKTLSNGKKIYIVVNGYRCPRGWYRAY